MSFQEDGFLKFEMKKKFKQVKQMGIMYMVRWKDIKIILKNYKNIFKKVVDNGGYFVKKYGNKVND